VDEFQDTNSHQYELIRIIAQGCNNICVCGDDDQSIFSWRGAEVGNILDFENDFQGTVIVKLEENYRSTQTILDAANAVIKNNENRLGKTLFTNLGQGSPIVYYESDDEHDESHYVANVIDQMRREGEKLSDVAVLYRVNSLSRNTEEAFLAQNIPYQMIGSIRFYERAEVKDVMSYLKFAVNPMDRISFERAIASPKRGIGESSFQKIYDFAEFKATDLLTVSANANVIVGLSAKAKKGLEAFSRVIRKINEAPDVGEAVRISIKDSGYYESLENSKDEKADSRRENLNELQRSAFEFLETSQRDEEESTLRDFVQRVALISATDFSEEHVEQVQMMSVHSAKGLEFSHVFIMGLEDDLFPLYRSENTQEERRLFYVALTRAKKTLHLTYALSRMKYTSGYHVNCKPSRFLYEIPDHLFEGDDAINYQGDDYFDEDSRSYDYLNSLRKKKASKYEPGKKYTSDIYGTGTIIQVSENRDSTVITVAFAGQGIKKFTV
jgi:DNA helicase-2/ATP-dependent DNA helicase PcrA